MLLTVYPKDGGCKFQADGMYTNSQTVAASDPQTSGLGEY